MYVTNGVNSCFFSFLYWIYFLVPPVIHNKNDIIMSENIYKIKYWDLVNHSIIAGMFIKNPIIILYGIFLDVFSSDKLVIIEYNIEYVEPNNTNSIKTFINNE